ncbi:MAG: hypothetical protein E7547_07365 [Ruminococcaceae bacterium]|nr:hypothetical protein [Oscillospiraceae bacterium]
MFSRIIAVIMCIVSFFTAPFSQLFSEIDLKSELAKGNYESPYIVRPLDGITVNGVSVDEYTVVVPQGTLYANAAQTLCNEFYKACGKKIAVTENAAQKAFIIDEVLNDSDMFSLKVENGNVYITGSLCAGISRGITAFADEVLLKSQGVYDFQNGYEYNKTFSDYVTYEDFGAVGDGKTDDFEAVVKTHEYANTNGLSVFANETATYYIGGANKTACIMTDTDWSTARFIIDDTQVENRSAWIFNIAPSQGGINITDKVSPLKSDAKNIGSPLDGKSLVVLTDSNVKRYIRKGANQNSGSNQTDVILVDENGNISPDTPLIWDFDSITSATAYPIDTEKLTVKGGKFTTLANNAASEYNYYARGIQVRRSNTVVDGLYHDIKNEGKTGAPYSAFVSLSCCADVTVKNCTFTGHKKYSTTGSAGTSVAMGTYDIGAATAVNARFINCNQTNDITDNDYWGIAGTNYCKNLVYDGCALSRFDAHQGVLNATVKNSVLGHHGIKLIGSGTALIENTTVLSDSFIALRSDYGSTWNGELIIRNCKFYPTGISSHIIDAENSEDHDFGYTCYLPQRIAVDGFYVHRTGNNYLFTKVNSKHNSDSYDAEYPVVPPQEITVKDFSCLLFGEIFVSKNKAIFKTEISS